MVDAAEKKKPGVPGALLVILLVIVAFCSVLHALARPFWYDEICTVIVCRLPGAGAIWDALNKALDGNPPLFYLAARAARWLVPDDHLGYRLISIIGLLGSLTNVYLFLDRRLNTVSALLGSSFLLCTVFADYAYEARPYALLVCFIAIAMLAWQRLDDSRWYALALAAALMIAESLHYYAVFAWPAFILAEAVLVFSRRRLRLEAWAAFFVGAALPLLLFRQLLVNMRNYSGPHFWAQPSLQQIFLIPSSLLNAVGSLGLAIAIALSGVLWWLIQENKSGERRDSMPLEEQILTLVLLWLPLISVIAAIVLHGGMTSRYAMPAVLGIALAVGQLSARLPRVANLFLATIIIANFSLQSLGVTQAFLRGTLMSERNAFTEHIQALVDQHAAGGLPLVVSSALEYLPMVYYAPAEARKHLTILVDPAGELQFQGSDSTDLGLLLQRQYFPLQAVDYATFACQHRSFVLLSEGDMDWWPSRLAHDGQQLRLLSESGRSRFYLVTLNAPASEGLVTRTAH